MVHRYIRLPIDEPACHGRLHVCVQVGFCARALVALDRGRPLRDYTQDWVSGQCEGLITRDQAEELWLAVNSEKEARPAIKGIA